MTETELTEVESIEDKGPVPQLWGPKIENSAPSLQWGAFNAFDGGEEPGGDPGCLPFKGGPGNFNCNVSLLQSLAGQAVGFLHRLTRLGYSDPSNSHFQNGWDYCNSLCVGLFLNLTQKLQLVWNLAVHLMTVVSWWTHVQPTALASCYLLDSFQVLELIFKTLYDKGPAYFWDHLSLHPREPCILQINILWFPA